MYEIGLKVGEMVRIGDDIYLRVVDILPSFNGDRVRLGVEAPRSVRIDREEIHKRRKEMGHDSRSV